MEVIHDKERLMPLRTKHYKQYNPNTEPYLFWQAVMQNSELDQLQKITTLMINGLSPDEAPEVTA